MSDYGKKAGRTWVYSDPHFYHTNICKFTNYDGSKVRPWDDANEMTEDMIRWYNELVHPDDRVYILGDVAFGAMRMRDSVSRLMGRKVLVKGNHDPDGHRGMYNDLFDDVRGYVIRKGYIMSHIPIHPHSMSRWQINIHGHLHGNHVQVTQTKRAHGRMTGVETVDDPRYVNVCVENTNWRPIDLDEILKKNNLK